MEANLKLIRFYYGPTATIGSLFYPDGRASFVYTMEPQWQGNEPFISCIPQGFYRITRDDFRGKYANFRLHDVLDRWDIEMHHGNLPSDTEGCIMVGMSVRGHVGYGWRLVDSERALDLVMDATRAEEGKIIVTSDTGRPT